MSDQEVFTVFIESEYVPEWNNNKNRSTPIVFEHREPTMRLRNRLIPKPKLDLRIDVNGKMEGGNTSMVVDNERIVREMTTAIRNFPYKKKFSDGSEKEFTVKTVDDLFSESAPSSFGSLIDEIGVYYQKLLNREIDTKN